MGALGQETTKKQASLASFFRAPSRKKRRRAGGQQQAEEVKNDGRGSSSSSSSSTVMTVEGPAASPTAAKPHKAALSEKKRKLEAAQPQGDPPTDDVPPPPPTTSRSSGLETKVVTATQDALPPPSHSPLPVPEDHDQSPDMVLEEAGEDQVLTSRGGGGYSGSSGSGGKADHVVSEPDGRGADGGGVVDKTNAREEEQQQEEEEEEEEEEDDDDDDDDDDNDDDKDPFCRDEKRLTRYERERLERIRKNEEFLASLGLDSHKPSALLAKQQKPKKPKKPRPAAAPSLPKRRSSRLIGLPQPSLVYGAGETDEVVVQDPEPEPEPEVEVDYDDSTVFKYICGEGSCSLAPGTLTAAFLNQSQAPSASKGDLSPNLRGFTYPHQWEDRCLSAPALSAIYSLHFNTHHRPLLAAGGKQGRVAIFDASHLTNGDHIGPSSTSTATPSSALLMSFRGHGGWVAGVRFVCGGGSGGKVVLLTAGNDGLVKVWDVCKVTSQGMPKNLYTAKDLHSKGIFSMDEAEGGAAVATGSKDATVTISQLTPTELRPVTSLDEIHEAVVKCVRFRGSHLLASSGDDCSVKVVDLRAPNTSSSASAISVAIESAHIRTTHSVRWHPTNEHLLATAGLDAYVHLYDLRSPRQPLHRLFGHVSSIVSKPKDINHPEFYGDGSWLLTSGERSQKLSIYDTATGVTISRGRLESDISLITPIHHGQANNHKMMILVADRRGRIVGLVPFHHQPPSAP